MDFYICIKIYIFINKGGLKLMSSMPSRVHSLRFPTIGTFICTFVFLYVVSYRICLFVYKNIFIEFTR